jgi:hypothetical protein
VSVVRGDLWDYRLERVSLLVISGERGFVNLDFGGHVRVLYFSVLPLDVLSFDPKLLDKATLLLG